MQRQGIARASTYDESVLPSDDEQLPATLKIAKYKQSEEFAAYEKFVSHANGFGRQLLIFADAMAQLGASAKIVNACCDLHERLWSLLEIYRLNAAALFPQNAKIRKAQKESAVSHGPLDLRPSRRRLKLPPLATPLERGRMQLSDLPTALHSLAHDLVRFSACLEDFEEFVDEALGATIDLFERDLSYWASSMRDFEAQMKLPAERNSDDRFPLYDIARYLHNLSDDVGEHLESVTRALDVLVRVRVPTVRSMQHRRTAHFANMTTIATFFSAVTATTLQFSFENHDTPLESLVNGFWFTSLVFSVASAVNSLASLTWIPAMYRSPESRVPWLLRVWIKRTPLIFLSAAIAAFSVGFVLFTYSSKQVVALRITVVVCTACSMCGIAAVGIWFLLERLVFLWHGGLVWLPELMDAHRGGAELLSSVDLPPERQDQQFAQSDQQLEEIVVTGGTAMTRRRAAGRTRVQVLHRLLRRIQGERFTAEPIQHTWPKFGGGRRMLNHIKDARPELQSLSFVQVAEHDDSVKDIAFSPNGEYLATVSSDKLGRVFAVSSQVDKKEYHFGFGRLSDRASNVCWAPNGAYLLVNDSHSVTLWTTSNFVRQFRYLSPLNPISGAKWFPTGVSQTWAGEFLIIKKNDALHMDVKENILTTYAFERLRLFDIAISPDGDFLFAVAALVETADRHTPAKARRQRRIVAYDRKERKIRYQVPVYHQARYITLSADGQYALVAYEDKVPPELWSIGDTRQHHHAHLVHSYLPKKQTRFVGRCSFGGNNDRPDLVVCANDAGHVFIWDLASTTLLHVLKRGADGDRITCVAWNLHVSNGYMLATGTHEGTVRLWKSKGFAFAAKTLTSEPVALKE